MQYAIVDLPIDTNGVFELPPGWHVLNVIGLVDKQDYTGILAAWKESSMYARVAVLRANVTV